MLIERCSAAGVVSVAFAALLAYVVIPSHAPLSMPRILGAPVAVPATRIGAAPARAAPPMRNSPLPALAIHATDGASHDDDLLAIAAFCGRESTALEYTVTRAGEEFDVREVQDWASQNGRSKHLSDRDLVRLRAAVRRLPSDDRSSPPIDRLVVIGFRSGTAWGVRTYDRADLPDAMREIYEVIGERPETRTCARLRAR
jgi:hypothetical protein